MELKVGDKIYHYNYWEGLPDVPVCGVVSKIEDCFVYWKEEGFDFERSSYEDYIFLSEEDVFKQYKQDLLDYKSYLENELRLVSLNLETFPKSWIKEEMKKVREES